MKCSEEYRPLCPLYSFPSYITAHQPSSLRVVFLDEIWFCSLFPYLLVVNAFIPAPIFPPLRPTRCPTGPRLALVLREIVPSLL